jgi:hypothetical protein
VACVLVLSVITACQGRCTEIGCRPGVQIRWKDPNPGKVCILEECVDLELDAEDFLDLSDSSGKPEVTVTVTRNGVAESVKVDLKKVMPNGPQCPPSCLIGELDVQSSS